MNSSRSIRSVWRFLKRFVDRVDALGSVDGLLESFAQKFRDNDRTAQISNSGNVHAHASIGFRCVTAQRNPDINDARQTAAVGNVIEVDDGRVQRAQHVDAMTLGNRQSVCHSNLPLDEPQIIAQNLIRPSPRDGVKPWGAAA